MNKGATDAVGWRDPASHYLYLAAGAIFMPARAHLHSAEQHAQHRDGSLFPPKQLFSVLSRAGWRPARPLLEVFVRREGVPWDAHSGPVGLRQFAVI